jgi:tRNA(Ile)-lysidine synthase
MALLSLLAENLPKENLLVAHLDHALREESAKEALWAGQVAKKMGLAFKTARREVKLLAQERGKGLEEAARKARYEFLEGELSLWGGDYIVTAHQADDQAETIILRLSRGVGPGGLAGIPEVNGRIIRPLLGLTRSEILTYLSGSELTWLEDPSNSDPRFDRNWVRLNILPAMETLNPAVKTALGRAASLAAAEEEFWQSWLDRLEGSLVANLSDGRFSLEAAGLMALTLAERRRLVGRLLRRIKIPSPGGGEPVSFQSVEMFLDYVGREQEGGVDLPGGRRVQRQGRFLHIGLASRYLSAYSG